MFTAEHNGTFTGASMTINHTEAQAGRFSGGHCPLVKYLAKNVRKLRSIRGMTQEELAEKTGGGKWKISRIESGAHTITIDHLYLVAKALDVEPELLLISKPQDCLIVKGGKPIEWPAS